MEYAKNRFRFESLDIWKEAIRIASDLFKIGEELEKQRLWRFADQVRGVGMSIPNNIAESTGSNLIGDQRSSLRIAKKECFEAANILVILANENLISQECMELEYEKIFTLCKRITAYANSLSHPKSKN